MLRYYSGKQLKFRRNLKTLMEPKSQSFIPHERIPDEVMESYEQAYPQAVRQAKRMRQARGRDLDDWPEWCWLPLAGAYAIVEGAALAAGLKSIPLGDVGNLGAVLAWRWSRRAYLVAPEVCAAVAETGPDVDFAPSLLTRLPAWCVWIATPDMPDPIMGGCGFFAFGEYDVNRRTPELRLVLVAPTDGDCGNGGCRLLGLPIHLGYWGVAGGLTAMLEQCFEHQSKTNLGRTYEALSDAAATGRFSRRLAEWVAPRVAILAGLCMGRFTVEPLNMAARAMKNGVGRPTVPPRETAWWRLRPAPASPPPT